MGSEICPDDLRQILLPVAKSLITEAEFYFFGPSSLSLESSPFQWIKSGTEIFMDEDPLLAVRRKKDSSLMKGMTMLRDGALDAFISAGHTGALLASAKLYLSMLPGIDRPALMVLMPTRSGEMAVLDVGANVSVQVEHLIQFAKLGVAYQSTWGIEKPTIGLLNIGAEERKGTSQLRSAYLELQKLHATKQDAIFLGNIEGRDAFEGHVHVLVTDGFTGNVFLKTSEGLASYILHLFKEAKDTQLPPSLEQQLNWEKYPGALLVGIDKIVIKCHGEGSGSSFQRSMAEAVCLLQLGYLEKVKQRLLHDR